MKFRKKPVIIEAEQFDGVHLPEGCYGLDDCSYIGNSYEHRGCVPHCFIKTLEGIMRANEGDWVIIGIKGEKYPCKPDIFKMTYEKVEEEK